MIFQLQRRMGALFASIALMGGHLGGSNTWAASADEVLTCDIVLDYFTWEDKTLPIKQMPVPSNKVLKYGIGHILAERFDIGAGKDNFMASNTFASFEIKNADPDRLEDHPLGGEDSQLEDQDEDEQPLGEELTSSSSSLRRSLQSQRRKIPKYCMRNYACKSRWYLRRASRHTNRGTLAIGFCNLCADDDNGPWTEGLDLTIPREFTLDELKALSLSHASYQNYVASNNNDATAANSLSGGRPAHQLFERDVCAEIRNLEEDYPSFARSEGCKITFQCRKLPDSDSDDDSDLIIVDHRNHQGDEIHDHEANANGNANANGDDTRGLLYSVAKLASKESHKKKDDEVLYSVTAAP